MKGDIGIIRPIDKLGRIVIPKEMRDRVLLETNVEILLKDEGILIRNAEYDIIKVKKDRGTTENN